MGWTIGTCSMSTCNCLGAAKMASVSEKNGNSVSGGKPERGGLTGSGTGLEPKPIRVSVIDDDPMICQAMSLILNDYSHGRIEVVSTSTDGETCVRRAAEEKPDVVHICTPHYLHAPLACLAMKRGCHVLTEKPMAIALADARRMLDTAAATGRTLGVIFQNRYNAGSQLIRRCLDNGDLGEVRAARVLLTWDRSPEYYSQSDWKGTWDKEGGGVIIDQAIHTLDLMRWFIGRPVTGVQASLANRTHPDIPVEDTAEGRVEFEGGAYGAFYVMNHYCTDEPVRLELACTRGKAVMEGPKARVELNNGLTCLADNDPAQMFEYGDVKQYWGTSHVKQIGNFYQSLLGLAPMYVTAENAFLTQEMICALYEHGRRHFVREVR
mgnify:CR=1 FL=1